MTAEDKRGIREIVLSIEKKLDTRPAQPKARAKDNGKGVARHRARPFTQRQAEALSVALEEIDKPFTAVALMDYANELEPGCLPDRSGSMTRSVQCFVAEQAGMKICWSKALSTFPEMDEEDNHD